MGNEHEKLIIGFIFILSGILYLLNLDFLSPLVEFSLTLAAFLLSVSGLFNEPIKENKKVSLFSLLKYVFYTLALMSLFVLPQFERSQYVNDLVTSINSTAFLMFGLGISFFTLHFSAKDIEKYKRKHQQDVLEARINERKEIMAEIYKKGKKDK
ncbi:hypothetical protein [Halobacillus sp. A5]|uniref:hypothetical protein n=1 Tax=Halobacillus sp. A5 TaxID=2880263 RepID=UPI0020A66E95|nr:hypothetical protein [Halobacillus sp. A5]MCP3026893.1 hypothetical protein [Halobacillus sp. A5]